ncbi:MAG TPA: DNA replication/repair protein RecF [Coriobacteriia bacterium]
MPIRHLELCDFRNYGRFEAWPGEELTVFVGPNAAGKTNMLEAIQLLTAGRSFKRPRWEELVRWGERAARATMEADAENGPLVVTLDVTSDGRRTYRVNGQVKRRVADVAGRLPSVAFTPDDLELAKGPSERRRSAIDDLGEQLSPAYAAVRRDYLKVVRHRNVLLRDAAPPEALGPWDEQLVTLGTKLLKHRTGLHARLEEHVARVYAELARGERLTAEYHDKLGFGPRAWEAGVAPAAISEAFRARLSARADEERARQVTLVGPHRDDIVFSIYGNEARTYASQGQLRTIALAWKLAEVRVVEEIAHREPVLLLDDVMSELDEERRAALTGVVRRDVQTFVTTTNLGYFDPGLLAGATIVELGR